MEGMEANRNEHSHFLITGKILIESSPIRSLIMSYNVYAFMPSLCLHWP